MAPEPNDQEFEAVLSLPPEERYEHFLRRAFDFDEVWMATDEEGLITVNAPDGRETLLVWPARRYAENALKREWPEASYLAVAVEDWLELTLRPLKDTDDVVLAVFCDSEGLGFCPGLPDVIADLEAELGTRL